ncbi:MAG TPA: hypothetical protein VKY74_06695 [Chloroflexia bacterium]|nr:hypothetical protein [Chloroflexia bacterium]
MTIGPLLRVVGSVVATVFILGVMVREGFPLWMEGGMLVFMIVIIGINMWRAAGFGGRH